MSPTVVVWVERTESLPPVWSTSWVVAVVDEAPSWATYETPGMRLAPTLPPAADVVLREMVRTPATAGTHFAPAPASLACTDPLMPEMSASPGMLTGRRVRVVGPL